MISNGSWSVLTTNFLVVLYLSLGGVTLAAILHLVNAKWREQVRVLSVAAFGLYPLAGVLLVILLAAGKLTFPWLNSTEHLPGWHHYSFFVVREAVAFVIVGLLCLRFIRLQAVSEDSEANWQSFHQTAILIPFAYVLYGTMIAWDFEMTMLPGWHSAIYGLYHFISNFGMFLAFFVVLANYLCCYGKLTQALPDYVFNYLAQLLLAFTILWIYTFFAQYLTIWYGNLPYEKDRIDGMELGAYAPLWWTFFLLKFLFPFVMLIFQRVRHDVNLIVVLAFSILLGTWLERYTWVSAVYGKGHLPMTAWFDVGVTVAVIVAAVMLLRRALRNNQLLAV
jgi:hypothetical protein